MPDIPLHTDERRSSSEHESPHLADLLSDPHCRLLLEYLHQQQGPASVSAVTRYIVAEVTDTPPEEVSEDVVRRVQTWLHLGQLPVLEDYGVVEFDADAGTVALRDGGVG